MDAPDTTTVKPSLPRSILRSMRPRQWVKNILLLSGLYFPDTGRGGPLLFNPGEVGRALAGFGLFCMLAGSIYLLNDAIDAPKDRLHPKKRFRPVAAGEIDAGLAKIFAAVIGLVALALSFKLSLAFGLCATAYLGMEVAYCLALKDVFLIDTMIISMGFIIRAVSGIIVLRTTEHNVELTPWFVICVMFLSLLLAFCKRRGELESNRKRPESHRKVLQFYTGPLLDVGIGVCAAATILAYAIYAAENDRPWRMIATLPFVIYGVFRYLHLVYAGGEGEAPEEVFLKDTSLLGCVVLWGLALVLVFYPT